MPQIFPAPNCNRAGGFSLIEVLVATAIVAIMVAATSSTVAASRSASTASQFLRQSLNLSSIVQSSAYGIDEETENKSISSEMETITSDEAGQVPAWRLYTLRPAAGDRRVIFALEAAGLP